MGCLLIWDLLRLINPSHVIHLTTGNRSLDMTYNPNAWFSRDLVPVNDFTYHHCLGWLLPPPAQCSLDATSSDTSGYVSKFLSDQCSSEFLSDGETATTTETDTAAVTLSKGTMVIKKWKMKARRKKLKRLRERKKHIPAQLTSPRTTFIKRKHRCYHVKSQTRWSRRTHNNTQHRTHNSTQHRTLQNTNWQTCGPFQLLTFCTTSHFVQSRLVTLLCTCLSHHVYVAAQSN